MFGRRARILTVTQRGATGAQCYLLEVQSYERAFTVRWGDMDFNAHMRNTAYLDTAADVRMMYFVSHGFPMEEFRRLNIGPVVTKDEMEYFREMHLLEEGRVTLELAGMSADGSRFTIRNVIFRGDTLVARVTSTVGWLDLSFRRWVVPPKELLAIMQKMPRIAEFVELPSGLLRRSG